MQTISLITFFITSIGLSLRDYFNHFNKNITLLFRFLSLISCLLSLITLHMLATILFMFMFYLSIVIPKLVVRKPTIISSNTPFAKTMENVLSLKPFRLPLYILDGITQTIVVFAKKFFSKQEFTRQLINAFDGNELAIDWLNNSNELVDDTPILLIFHGLAGGCRESYIQRFCYYARKNYRIVVYTYRGCAGTVMKQPRAYNITCLEDYRTCIEAVHEKYPTAPIIGIGYSMGGMVTTAFGCRMNEYRDKCNFIGTVAVSPTWSSLSSFGTIPSVFMESFTKSLAHIALKNKDTFINGMENDVPTFDNHFDCKLFGFGHWQTYYYDIEQWYHLLPKSKIPLLIINAEDDPIAIINWFIRQRIHNMVASSKTINYIETKQGGHLGWVTGDKTISFVDKTTLEYCDQLAKMFKEGTLIEQLP
ncbi:AB hydrolase-1 domain-containing protein [Entamoeba marina]